MPTDSLRATVVRPGSNPGAGRDDQTGNQPSVRLPPDSEYEQLQPPHMSTKQQDGETDDLDWRQRIVAEQNRDVPKERGRTYYYADGLFDRKQIWLKHNPGCNTAMRVKKVFQPGLFGDDYDSTLEMNIGTEKDAYRLYLVLEAYFNDVRTQPWFLTDIEVVDDSDVSDTDGVSDE